MIYFNMKRFLTTGDDLGGRSNQHTRVTLSACPDLVRRQARGRDDLPTLTFTRGNA